MSSRAESEYDDFVSFVASVESDLRFSARLAAGDEATAGRLTRRTLARLAQRWRWVKDDDPQATLLDLVADEANRLWRDEKDTGDAEPDPTGIDTASSLAAEAWRAGQRLRRRRRNGVVVVLLLVAVIAVGYALVTTASSSTPPKEPDPAHAAAVTATLAVLPPPDTAANAPGLDTQLGADDSDVNVAAPSLSKHPTDVFAAAFQIHDGNTGVVGGDGRARMITDATVGNAAALFPRAVSPGGKLLALAIDTTIVTVDTRGKLTTVRHNDSRPTDLAWYPNGKYLMLTAANGTFRVDAATGKRTSVGWYGASTVFDADSQGAREYVDMGGRAGIQTWWNGQPHGKPRSFGVDELPISEWDGAPYLEPSQNLLARKCVPGKRMKLPEGYAKPRSCVAVVKPSGAVSAILALTSDYGARDSATVLGAEDGQVYLLAGADDNAARLLLAWDTDNNEIHLVSTIGNAASFVLGDIAA